MRNFQHLINDNIFCNSGNLIRVLSRTSRVQTIIIKAKSSEINIKERIIAIFLYQIKKFLISEGWKFLKIPEILSRVQDHLKSSNDSYEHSKCKAKTNIREDIAIFFMFRFVKLTPKKFIT